MSSERIYLDYNATTPLNEPCKKAMIETMALCGNASAVHAEGRRARSLIEIAREQVAVAIDCKPENLIFTSGATEGASLLLREKNISCAEVEHPCVSHWCDKILKVSRKGKIRTTNLTKNAVQLANSETGVLQSAKEGLYMSDIVQLVGKVKFSFESSGIRSAIIAAHKFGGPQGIGAVIAKTDVEINPQIIGGGQEKGYRSGTESLASIVGLGAAIKFAKIQLDDGVWAKVEELRNLFEDELANSSPRTIFVGKEGSRLPNTSCFITPGWPGDMQVMQMDISGFSVSAGSACSSGKVTKSSTLNAMGYGKEQAECSVRVSIGTKTTKREIQSFVKEWTRVYLDRHRRVA